MKRTTIIGGAFALIVVVAIFGVAVMPSSTHTFNFIAEKNHYISLPVMPGYSNTIYLFSPGVNVLGYDPLISGGWYVPTTLEVGKGYLIYTPSPLYMEIEGEKVVMTREQLIAALQPGWNLVGPGWRNIDLTGTGYVAEGHDMATGEWYNTTTLVRGQGYWIEV